MAALGLGSIAELVRLAVGSGLLEADSSQAAVQAARPSAA